MSKATEKFETIGANYQYAAHSIEQANKFFATSCHCCCHRGYHLSCDQCGIAVAHNLMVALFQDKNNNNVKEN